MSTIRLYLELGISHIANLKGYDHLLFILSLCAVYLFRQWKQVLILVTAFTLGHTCTLALATLHVIHVSSEWIEFLIPLTIFLTAFSNIFKGSSSEKPLLWRMKYLAALFFGLIHGLGFSTYLRELLGNEGNVIKPLFAFNLGIEIGQIVFVGCLLCLTQLMVSRLRFPPREWTVLQSGAGMGISLLLIFQRIPWS